MWHLYFIAFDAGDCPRSEGMKVLLKHPPLHPKSADTCSESSLLGSPAFLQRLPIGRIALVEDHLGGRFVVSKANAVTVLQDAKFLETRFGPVAARLEDGKRHRHSAKVSPVHSEDLGTEVHYPADEKFSSVGGGPNLCHLGKR